MVRFVAEVSSNHNRSLPRCQELIDRAAGVGCAAVKFQLFRIDQLFAGEALDACPHLAARRDWELPEEFIPELAERCRQREIAFACTPFYLAAVEKLYPYVDFYKVASYELLWHDLLRECAKTGKPVVLSVGMADWAEIDAAVDVVYSTGNRRLTLLHCVSGYPAPAGQCNLAVIESLRRRYKCPVGWSDHSVSRAVIGRAVNRWRAEMIEFHLDSDGRGYEFATGHCWLPDDIAAVIDDCRQGMAADGRGDKPLSPAEAADRQWRADPGDGLRPLLAVRRQLAGGRSRSGGEL
ncbi:MAG: N-acetylneuraminate synthase family protein [Negativicutes bacterium]|nr:N-acetylneuraminate synthase family protein [Negativicutes bacterium]